MRVFHGVGRNGEAVKRITRSSIDFTAVASGEKEKKGIDFSAIYQKCKSLRIGKPDE
jgi:hypothetical protein